MMMRSREEMLSITFRDVSACFSEEEWNLLHEWQKELYKNVMEEIHQALISLGHKILNLDTLLQIKKTEELNFRDPLDTGITADMMAPPSSCYPAVTPDILLRINQDEEPRHRDGYVSKGVKLSSNPIAGPPAVTSVLFRTKEEQEPCLIDKQDIGNITASKTDDPVITSVFSLSLEHQEDPCLLNTPEPEEMSFDNPVITSVFSLNIKCEDETHFEKELEHDGRTTGKPAAYSLGVKLEGGRRVKEEPMTELEASSDAGKRKYEDSLKYTKNPALCKDISGKAQLEVLQSLQKKTHCGSVLSPGSTPEPGRNIPTFSKSGVGYPTHSNSHRATPKVEGSDTHAESESNERNVNPFVWQPDTQPMWRPFKCTECETYFSQSEDLFMHEQIHAGEGPYPCTICEKSFSLKEDFTAHQKIHTKPPVKNIPPVQIIPVVASIQRETPTGQTKLEVKTYSYTHQCPKCEKSFMLKESLSIHLKTHVEIKPHQCTMCDKSFNQKEILMRHIKIHTEDKPYPCTDCGIKFTHLVGLVTHQRKHVCKKPSPSIVYRQCFVQLGDRVPVQGTNARDSKKPNLTAVSHTQKPFKCKKCSERFSRRVGLVRHERSHVETK